MGMTKHFQVPCFAQAVTRTKCLPHDLQTQVETYATGVSGFAIASYLCRPPMQADLSLKQAKACWIGFLGDDCARLSAFSRCSWPHFRPAIGPCKMPSCVQPRLCQRFHICMRKRAMHFIRTKVLTQAHIAMTFPLCMFHSGIDISCDFGDN